jgi:Tol biopolymer transport system component
MNESVRKRVEHLTQPPRAMPSRGPGARFSAWKAIILFIAAGLLSSLAACASGMPLPTATAIPLAATATPSPRPTQAQSTATEAAATPPPIVGAATPSPISPGISSELNQRLAKLTVQGFLDRLATGNATGASDLYLTDRAKEGQAAQLLSRIAGSEARLAGVALLQFLWTSDTSYEAQAELSWAASDGSNPTSQTMTLYLTYEQGLWRIDDVALGRLQPKSPGAPAPATTSKPGSGTSRQPDQLAGKLVFQASSGGDIYVIQADGSGLRRLTDGLDPAWSPDGRHIAFTRWRHPWGVYLIDAESADPSSSEMRVVDAIQLKEVAWSPDGSRIAFTINFSSSESFTICFFGFCFTIPPFSFGQIWTADLDTGYLLSLPLDDEAVHAPAWSPAGERIVYAGDRGLAWIDLDDMDKGHFEGGSVWDTSPTFSPDGRRIAFMGRVHNRWEIFAMDADGGGRQQLTQSDPKLKAPPSNVAPAWSPDGRQIAFLSNRDGPWRIYVMNADGSRQRPMFGDRLDGLGIRYEWATERVISWGR